MIQTPTDLRAAAISPGAPIPPAAPSELAQPQRTGWAEASPLLTEYYDREWGMPVRDERGVFEQLALEGFQAGLSWRTVLRKREALREAFDGFVPDRVAAFDVADIERLLGDVRLIRNRGKIEAVIHNAHMTLALRAQGTDLAELVWSFLPERSPAPMRDSQVPRMSRESTALAKTLKSHGFQYVGPTTMFALMAAIGVVDAHLVTSHRRGCSGLFNRDGTRTALAQQFAGAAG